MCIVWPPSFAFDQTGTSVFLKEPGKFLLFVHFGFHEGYAVSGYDGMTISNSVVGGVGWGNGDCWIVMTLYIQVPLSVKNLFIFSRELKRLRLHSSGLKIQVVSGSF